MTGAFLLFFAGLLLLYYGAEYLVSASARLALVLGIRPLVIGMTVVAFATSMPEMMVSLLAALRGSADIATGNIIGSNIANIGLILGTAALMSPMAVGRQTLRMEIPFMIGASVLLYVFALDGRLGFLDGLILFLLLLVFLVWCVKTSRIPDVQADKDLSGSRRKDLFFIAVGIVGLGVGAELMVRSAVTIARGFGVSELIIGLSVVALGTSLPELAASVFSAWRGEMDLSIGNVIGSNIFNILFVLGICPMVTPFIVAPSVLRVEFPVMLLFSAALLALAAHRRFLGRGKGGILLAGYFVFIASLYV